MRISTLYVLVLMTALVITATDATAGDNVYRWLDEDGNVHFGDRPPDQSNAEKINIETGTSSTAEPSTDSGAPTPSTQPSYAQQQREERALKRKESAAKQKAVAEGCRQRLAAKAQLEPSTRVMVTTEKGEVYRMDDNDRLNELAKLNAYISENCRS